LRYRLWKEARKNVRKMGMNGRLAAREAVRRREDDGNLVAPMAKQIGILFPGCPAHELGRIAEHTAARGSGRVDRPEAGRNLEERALTAAGIAAARHNDTKYNKLQAQEVDRATARQRGSP
jgi:hypothetical protein